MRYGDWRVVSGVRVPFEERETESSQVPEQYSRVNSIEINAPVPTALLSRPASVRLWSFADGQRGTGWIDFEFFEGHQIFIPALLNGQPTKVLLDSGAGITVLDSGLAQRLGVKATGELPVSGTERTTIKVGSNLRIGLGSLTLQHITAGITHLQGIAAQMGHALPLVLGREVFNQLIIDIDFQHHRLAFADPEGYAAPAGALHVALGRHGNQRTVPLAIEGAAPAPFDFDLGNDNALIVYAAYRERLRILDSRRQSLELMGGIGGIVKVRIATLRELSIAGQRLVDVPTEFPDPTNSGFDSNQTAGNVGLPLLSRFRLITDYPRDALWLLPDPKAIAKSFDRNRSGLMAEPHKSSLMVLLVAPGSPAERAGWKTGDEVVAINGQAIDATYSGSALSHWAEQAAGTVVTLSKADHSKNRLTLADYF